MNTLCHPDFYKKEVQVRKELELAKSKSRVTSFLVKIHKALSKIDKWNPSFTLTFEHCSELENPDIFELDIPYLIEAVLKQGWSIDPKSIKWHHCEGIKDGIFSLEIGPAIDQTVIQEEEINVID